ncbi:hypothetical protein [Streptomyces purpureus]|uniref:Secreted protein n=1 Tax=Streptomyces purpureus TaxID=1951 RepID=A0A918H011_9ACTN|nr:hypothetical protein [Streptomyces purpureus]GGT22008.1 hypothetical protein GCM10014713_13790 [Streptomyces purpureus]
MRRTCLAAVALCLGGALTACGGGSGGDGYAAVGAAGSGGPAAAPPSGKVELTPLDSEATTSSTSVPRPGTSRGGPGAGSGAPTGEAPGRPGEGTHAPAPLPSIPPVPSVPSVPGASLPPGKPAVPGAKPPTGPPRTTAPATTDPPTATEPPPRPPAEPAALTLGVPVLADADRRWCEKVTVEFRNTGGSPVRSGTVIFATHIIGALGVDWATVETAQPLPAPIAAGAVTRKTYTVCVEAWRVPLGMRVDTQKVTAVWK